VIGGLVSDRVEGVDEHSPVDGDETGVEHIVAYAPLSSVPWGVVLEQREDTALALPNRLRQRVLIIAAAGLAVGLAMGWVTSRQVVLPLARLTGQARRIAEGNLAGPIAPEGQDEVRRLAVSFETMRGDSRHRSVNLPIGAQNLRSGFVSALPSWSSGTESGACCSIR